MKIKILKRIINKLINVDKKIIMINNIIKSNKIIIMKILKTKQNIQITDKNEKIRNTSMNRNLKSSNHSIKSIYMDNGDIKKRYSSLSKQKSLRCLRKY